MAGDKKRAFSGTLSQSIVVCLLGLFIVMTLIAMFSSVETGDETVWIGITADPLDAETAASLGIPRDKGGVLVREVEGIARKAGVRHGDVLLGINGNRILDVADFAKLADRTNLQGGGAELDIIRKGERIPVLVSPNGAPPAPLRAHRGALPAEVVRPLVVVDRQWLGIDAETFTGAEGRALGIPAGVGGVLIDGMVVGGRAERAGLMADDVIVSVNGRKTDTTADLWAVLAGLDGAGWVELGLYRGGRLVSVALPTAAGALVGGFPVRGGGWGAGQGRFPFCPTGRLPAAPLPRASVTPAGAFPGRMGGLGLGPGGSLVCPRCGTRVAHQRAVPGFTVPCPSCGTVMIRAR